jgi:hypothetical protein
MLSMKAKSGPLIWAVSNLKSSIAAVLRDVIRILHHLGLHICGHQEALIL